VCTRQQGNEPFFQMRSKHNDNRDMQSAQEDTHVMIGTRRRSIGQLVGTATLMAVSCLVTFWLITNLLAHYSVPRDKDLLGGMWAVVATIFVFRESILESARAALSRTIATFFSFALCFLYLLIFPFHVVGMVAVIWISSVIVPLVGRSEDVITTGITTAVVLVVAGLSPGPGWIQPILRLVDTVVGIAVGLLAFWVRTAAGLYPAPRRTND
jgi:hypothetical protein